MITNQLASARAALAAARAAHTEDLEALPRGRELLAQAEARLASLATLDAEDVTRESERLARHLRAGHAAPMPTVVPDDTAAAAERLQAERALATAKRVMDLLTRDEALSRAAVAEAEARMQSARAELTRAETDRIAAEMSTLLERYNALFAQLAVLDLDDLSGRNLLGPAALAALHTPATPPRLEQFIPRAGTVYDLNTHIGQGPDVAAAARQHWESFWARLDDAHDPESAVA